MKRIDDGDLDFEAYDEVIDVRSPSEFAIDHVPGAINLPVLDDAQRVEVGTRNSKASAFEARRLGAGYVSANIAVHLARHFSDKPPGYLPLVYCWRGGQRSASLAHVLERIGWTVHVLAQGYKSYRKCVRTDLERLPSGLRFAVLAGFTGCGKTKILGALRDRGEQVLDLEGLANHQGSLLGEPPDGQNVGQKLFESRLWDGLRRFDRSRMIWTEAESAKIGGVSVPKHLLHAVRGGAVYEVEADRAERSRFLSAGYHWWRENPKVLLAKLSRLRARYGHEEIERWRTLAEAGAWADFVDRVLAVHYDPAYARSRSKNFSTPIERVRVSALLEDGADRAAAELIARVALR